LVGSQVLAKHPVFSLGRATFSRARDGAIVESLPVTTNQHLRRSAHDGLVAESQKKHVWRRIDRAQGSINLQRVAGKLSRESLRQHNLITVAGGDVFFHLSHAFFESTAWKV